MERNGLFRYSEYRIVGLSLPGFGDDDVVGEHEHEQWFACDLGATKQSTLHH